MGLPFFRYILRVRVLEGVRGFLYRVFFRGRSFKAWEEKTAEEEIFWEQEFSFLRMKFLTRAGESRL